jgi:diketogulonate reductase-like aldo/keto reductase
MTTVNETHTLSNDVSIPKLGPGMWFIDDDKAAQAVRDAVEIGYRNTDTAQAYGNESGVGEGVRTASAPRDEAYTPTTSPRTHAKSTGTPPMPRVTRSWC